MARTAISVPCQPHEAIQPLSPVSRACSSDYVLGRGASTAHDGSCGAPYIRDEGCGESKGDGLQGTGAAVMIDSRWDGRDKIKEGSSQVGVARPMVLVGAWGSARLVGLSACRLVQAARTRLHGTLTPLVASTESIESIHCPTLPYVPCLT